MDCDSGINIVSRHSLEDQCEQKEPDKISQSGQATPNWTGNSHPNKSLALHQTKLQLAILEGHEARHRTWPILGLIQHIFKYSSALSNHAIP